MVAGDESGDFHDANVEVHLHSLLDGAEDLGQVVHARVAAMRQHAMQTLAGLVGQLGERLKANCCIHEVPQHEARCIGLPVQKKRCGFIQQGLRKSRVAPNAFGYRLLVIKGRAHPLCPFSYRGFRHFLERTLQAESLWLNGNVFVTFMPFVSLLGTTRAHVVSFVQPREAVPFSLCSSRHRPKRCSSSWL